MPEYGPGDKWVLVREIKADPGGCMAIVDGEAYRSPCAEHNPGVPIYTRTELEMIKQAPHSAQLFRIVQNVKRLFKNSRVIRTAREKEGGNGKA